MTRTVIAERSDAITMALAVPTKKHKLLRKKPLLPEVN